MIRGPALLAGLLHCVAVEAVCVVELLPLGDGEAHRAADGEEVLDGLPADLLDRRAVPGGEQQYFKNTFIVSKSKDDGFHPNMFTGYLTALFAYCAITGESAVGQTYAFCNDTSISSKFNFESYKSQYYTYDTFTNFTDVFASEADMNGLQQLVDQYLAEKAYRNY